MKKTIIVLAAMLVTSFAAKAWEVGDFYAQDPTGVPAIVAYVDESGEHGLIMAPLNFSTKGLKNLKNNPILFTKKQYQQIVNDLYSSNKIKQTAAEMQTKMLKLNIDSLKTIIDEQGDLYGETYQKTMAWLEQQNLPNDSKRKGFKEKLFNQYLSDLAASNTEYGESNTKAIIEYCQENGIDMQLYFPEVNYAMTLGEGWFVPGNYELELISTYYADSIGENYKQKTTEINEKKLVLTHKISEGAILYPNFSDLQSSTMTKSNWSESENNKEKVGKLLSTGGRNAGPLTQLIVLTISASEQAPYYTLTEINQGLSMKSWFIFAKNNYEAYPIVVRRF